MNQTRKTEVFAQVARIMKPDGTFMIVDESDCCDEVSKKSEAGS